ncbi:hypothetical protein [Ralstonia pseudosolanacearum]
MGNVSLDEIGQGISTAWQSDRIDQLTAAGDFAGAQAIRTQNVLGIASLAVGGEGLIAGATEVSGSFARTAAMGTRLAAEELADSRTAQIAGAMIEKRLYQAGAGPVYMMPPDFTVAATENVLVQDPDAAVAARLQELTAEGYGVQRHGAGVTGQQLIDRAVEGLDPMTGSTVDGVHGGTHQYAQNATKVLSDEAYVYAEHYARNSQQFLDATGASMTGRAQVELPLSDIFGDDFRGYVYGVTRYGSKAAPTGYGDTLFSNDAYMIVRYKQDAGGVWRFNTMFPQPE